MVCFPAYLIFLTFGRPQPLAEPEPPAWMEMLYNAIFLQDYKRLFVMGIKLICNYLTAEEAV